MLRNVLIGVLLGLIFRLGSVQAVAVNVVENSENNFSVYLDAEDDVFDAIGFKISANPSSPFQNVDNGFKGFLPRQPGDEYSFINGLLLPGTTSLGFSYLVWDIGPELLHYEGGPLGRTIRTPEPPGLFLANVVLPPRAASYDLQVVSRGQDLALLRGTIGIPEPSCWWIIAVGAIVWLGPRRSICCERSRRCRPTQNGRERIA